MRPSRRRVRALVPSVVALIAAIGAGLAVPGTSSAFTATVTDTRNTAASKDVFTCADEFAMRSRSDDAFFEYTLMDDAQSTGAPDVGSRGNTGTYDGAHDVDSGSSHPCASDPGSPYKLDGTTSRVLTSTFLAPIRTKFSLEIWFKTTGVSEKIIGFEGSHDAQSSNYDKHLYLDSRGVLRYAIYNSDGNVDTVDSPRPVNDGRWHQAVATTSATAGCVLYLDGVQVGTNTVKTRAEDFSGWWRIGNGNTQAWPDAPTMSSFAGSLAFAAAYGHVLTPDEVHAEYTIAAPKRDDLQEAPGSGTVTSTSGSAQQGQ